MSIELNLEFIAELGEEELLSNGPEAMLIADEECQWDDELLEAMGSFHSSEAIFDTKPSTLASDEDKTALALNELAKLFG